MIKNLVILFLFIIVSSSNLKAIDIKEVKFNKENKAWLVNDSNLPIVAVKFSFKAGSAYDPENKRGTANLVASLLDEGAGNYNAKEFKKKLADNSITLNFTTTQDNFYIDLYTLKENLELAFELLDLALTEPRFDL